jgi:hypothetical protein
MSLQVAAVPFLSYRQMGLHFLPYLRSLILIRPFFSRSLQKVTEMMAAWPASILIDLQIHPSLCHQFQNWDQKCKWRYQRQHITTTCNQRIKVTNLVTTTWTMTTTTARMPRLWCLFNRMDQMSIYPSNLRYLFKFPLLQHHPFHHLLLYFLQRIQVEIANSILLYLLPQL